MIFVRYPLFLLFAFASVFYIFRRRRGQKCNTPWEGKMSN